MSLINSIPIKLVIHWPRFGPYHISRINAVHRYLSAHDVEVVALEIASKDATYQWANATQEIQANKRVVFPNQIFDDIPPGELFFGIFRALNEIQPDVIAVNGYSSIDSWTIIAWSKLRHRRTILMMDSKEDDVKRSLIKETLKKWMVRNFDAGFCAGKKHQKYLNKLGMNISNISVGYDVVDNSYFWRKAEIVREHPKAYRDLPGLSSLTPYFLASSRFIKRKNLTGLLDAYYLYRERVVQSGNGSYPWRLVILGDGEERQHLESKIKEKAIEEVTLAGFRQIEELPAYYALASVFIHPALKDQWGLVVNEAMASGLPVLVSKHCGCVPELVQIGENGYVFEPEDTNDLANQMFRISSGEVDLAAMKQASLMVINDWGLERFAHGIYESTQVAVS